MNTEKNYRKTTDFQKEKYMRKKYLFWIIGIPAFLIICYLLIRLAYALFFIVLINQGDDTVPKDIVVDYVEQNYELLEQFPYHKIEEIDWSSETDADEDLELQIINEYLGDDTIVKSVYAYNENILKFYCGGSGIVTSSTYSGFYFSKDDTPHALDFDGSELTEIGKDIYEWDVGYKKISTEKIIDGWYYYYLEWD